MENTMNSIPAQREHRRQRGFTLVSMAITSILAGVVLLGGWVAYRSMTIQMKVAAADRQMDQYASSTFQELTNLLGWGWDAVQIQGGSRNPVWKFRFYDQSTPGLDFARSWRYGSRLQDSLMTLSYTPTRGVLLSRREPIWVGSGRSGQYVFTGRSPRFLQTNLMGRWDRMTVQGLTMDYVRPTYDHEHYKRLGTVDITLTLQYRYHPPTAGRGLIGLFENDYVRERTYKTSVFMRNWDVKSNPQRDVAWGIDG
jgi:hypothetical protein